MSTLAKVVKAASSPSSKPSLLVRLAAIATVVGGAWTVFITQYPGAVKGPIGAAVATLVAVWMNAEHATVRNTDNAAVAAMTAKTASSSIAQEANAALGDVLAGFGIHPPPSGPAGPGPT